MARSARISPYYTTLIVPLEGTCMIRMLHHNAYRCRDSEETRVFYEDFLGLPLVNTVDLSQTKTGRHTHTLHTFYRLDDGSCLAFFETDDFPFQFKQQHDFDLHIALEVGPEWLQPMIEKAKTWGIDVRGPADHGMVESIYLRDPNGYVIELCAKRASHDTDMDPVKNDARNRLQRWHEGKRQADAPPQPQAAKA
jgi:catechol 2,3-dioxygenase-like lactoylglutathione lyase family enzyme